MAAHREQQGEMNSGQLHRNSTPYYNSGSTCTRLAKRINPLGEVKTV